MSSSPSIPDSGYTDGGPAFPEAIAVGPAGDVYPGFSGMSLRDWFASQALIACIQKCVPQECEGDESLPAMFARKAYLVADAMLSARATGAKP